MKPRQIKKLTVVANARRHSNHTADMAGLRCAQDASDDYVDVVAGSRTARLIPVTSLALISLQ